MSRRPSLVGWTAVVFWLIAFAAMGLLSSQQNPAPGWDVKVYARAIHSLRKGHDVYEDGIAVQKAYHAEHPAMETHPLACEKPPCTYVYSPMTLPPLRAAAKLPRSGVVTVYVLLLAMGSVAMALAVLYAAEPGPERTIFALIAPATLFFPGLVLNYVVLSGNISYILYGAALATAVLGWHKHRWLPFYCAVVLASCYKAPLLSLLAIPLLSERRAWGRTGIAAVSGLLFFALQPLIWPALFRHYLEAVSLQFSYNKDFGVSPAGLLGSLLTAWRVSYSPWTTVGYGLYAAGLVWLLLDLRGRFLRGVFSLQAWLPVLLLGVLLLNPRIKEYDVALGTMPMALILWRLFARGRSLLQAALFSAVFVLAVQAVGTVSWTYLRVTYGTLLVALFLLGVWQLRRGDTSQFVPAWSRADP